MLVLELPSELGMLMEFRYRARAGAEDIDIDELTSVVAIVGRANVSISTPSSLTELVEDELLVWPV